MREKGFLKTRVGVFRLFFYFFFLIPVVLSRRSSLKREEAEAIYDLHAAARSGNSKLVKEILTSEILEEEGIHISPDAFVKSKAPLISALEGRHEAFDSRLMQYTFDIEGYTSTIHELLQSGADPAIYCPTVEALTYRSVESLDILLSRMNSSAVRDCIITIDNEGRNHWHLVSESPTAGLTRILMRAGKMNQSDPLTRSIHRIIKQEIGISEIPKLIGSQQFLMKSTIEDVLGVTDLDILVKAYLRSGGTAKEFEIEGAIAEKKGLNPFLTACQHGRYHVVRKFLTLKFYNAVTSKSIGPTTMTVTPPVGSTCAHLAALRGHVDVLTVLFEEQGISALLSLDASRRTPCDRIQQGQGGALLQGAYDFLKSKNACVSTIKENKNNTPSESLSTITRAGLSMRYFEPETFIKGGWTMLSNNSLLRYNLPLDLFTTWNKTIDSDSGIDIVTNASDSKIVRRYRSQSRPFLGVSAFDPANVIGPDGWKRGHFMSDFGSMTVSASDVPYSSIYGNSLSTNYSIREFIEKFMGLNATFSMSKSHFIDSKGEMSTSIPKEEDSTTSIPYVFDSNVIPSNARRFVPFLHYLQEFNPIYEKNKDTIKLRQLGLGPPGSGAMPHYHGEAVNILLFGLKLWTIWAPQYASFSGTTAKDFFEKRNDKSTSDTFSFPSISFIQEPGDIVYIPSFYCHATLNLADSFGIAIE